MIAFHDIWIHKSDEPVRYGDSIDWYVTRFWKEINGDKEEFQALDGFNIGIGLIRL